MTKVCDSSGSLVKSMVTSRGAKRDRLVLPPIIRVYCVCIIFLRVLPFRHNGSTGGVSFPATAHTATGALSGVRQVSRCQRPLPIRTLHPRARPVNLFRPLAHHNLLQPAPPAGRRPRPLPPCARGGHRG